MESRFLTVVWVAAAAIIAVMVPASRSMVGAQREWAQSAIAAPMFVGLAVTLIFNRVTRGFWLPGKDGKGTLWQGRCAIALMLMISAYFGLRPFHIVP
jgi:hypothetical protein